MGRFDRNDDVTQVRFASFPFLFLVGKGKHVRRVILTPKLRVEFSHGRVVHQDDRKGRQVELPSDFLQEFRQSSSVNSKLALSIEYGESQVLFSLRLLFFPQKTVQPLAC